MDYTNISHYKDYRKLAVESLGSKCVKCGKEYDLVIHHKEYSDAVKLKDVELLCRACHVKTINRTTQIKQNSKMITFNVSKSLLERMGKIREAEGISVTFQMCSGAEMYLKTKEKKK